MKVVVSGFLSYISKLWSLVSCLVLWSATGVALAQSSFTDRVQTAKARDSSSLLASTKTGVDNYQQIIGLGLMLVGFAIMTWGIFWVMSAARSDGRKESKPGWIMIGGGGALGAATVIYLLTVGVFSSVAT